MDIVNLDYNEQWFEVLKKLWFERMFCKGSSLRVMLSNLNIFVFPMAILPMHNTEKYKQYFFGKYVLDNEVLQKYPLLSLKSIFAKKQEADMIGLDDNITIASGAYKVLCSNIPSIFVKYHPDDNLNKQVNEIDINFNKHEKAYLKEYVGFEMYKNENGHYVIPVFFGVTPVFLLILISEQLINDVFEPSYIRHTFEIINKKAEQILYNSFIEYWELFCKKVTKGVTPKYKSALLIKLLKIILMQEPKRECYSYIHTLPEIPIKCNFWHKQVSQEFNIKWNNLSVRLVEPKIWYKNNFEMILLNPDVQQIFVNSTHDIENKNDIINLKKKIYKVVDSFKHIDFVLDLINQLDSGINDLSLYELRVISYKLKSILCNTKINVDMNQGYQISAGILEFWPSICEAYTDLDVTIILDESIVGENLISFYNFTKQININPFDFVTNFYDFVLEYNNGHCARAESKSTIEKIIFSLDFEEDGLLVTLKLSKPFPKYIESGLGITASCYRNFIATLPEGITINDKEIKFLIV